MNTNNPVIKGWLANGALLLVTFVWGATFTLTKDALQDVPVFSYLAVRFTIATALLVILSLLSPMTRKSFHTRTFVLGGVLGALLFGAYALQTLGLQYTSASAAGFLTGLSVVLVPLLGLPWLGIMPQGRSWLGTGLAIAGLVSLCGGDVFQFSAGDLLVLACAVFLAMQILMIEKYGREEDPLALATVEIGMLTVCCVLWIGFRIQSFPSLAHWQEPNVFVAVLICAIPGTAFAYWAQNVFQKYTTSAQTALIFSMEPVFAAMIAWLALHELFTPATRIGCLLILGGMLVSDPSLHWKRSRILQ